MDEFEVPQANSEAMHSLSRSPTRYISFFAVLAVSATVLYLLLVLWRLIGADKLFDEFLRSLTGRQAKVAPGGRTSQREVSCMKRVSALADYLLDHVDTVLVRVGLLPNAAGEQHTASSGTCSSCNGTSVCDACTGTLREATHVYEAFTTAPGSDTFYDLLLRTLSQRTLTSRLDCALRQPGLLPRLQEASARARAIRDAAALFAVGLTEWTWDRDGGMTTAGGNGEHRIAARPCIPGEEEGRDRPVFAFCFYVQLCSPFVALDMPGSAPACPCTGHDAQGQAHSCAPGAVSVDSRTCSCTGLDTVERRCTASSFMSPIIPVRLGEDPLRVAWRAMAEDERVRCGLEPALPFTEKHREASLGQGGRASSLASTAKFISGRGDEEDASQAAHDLIEPLKYCPYVVPFNLSSIAPISQSGAGQVFLPPPSSRKAYQNDSTLQVSATAFLVAELDGMHDRAVFVVEAGVERLALEHLSDIPLTEPCTTRVAEEGVGRGTDETPLGVIPAQIGSSAKQLSGGSNLDDWATSALSVIATISGPLPLLHIALEAVPRFTLPLHEQEYGTAVRIRANKVEGKEDMDSTMPVGGEEGVYPAEVQTAAMDLVLALDAVFMTAAQAEPAKEVAALTRALAASCAMAKAGRLPFQIGNGKRTARNKGGFAAGRLIRPTQRGGDGMVHVAARVQHDGVQGHVRLGTDGVVADDMYDVSRDGVDAASRDLELEVATHPSTLLLLRAAALSRSGQWGRVVTDVHAALAWGAGLFQPHTQGREREEGADCFSIAWRFDLPPRLKREAWLLLGTAWQVLSCPKAAVVAFDTAVQHGAKECEGVEAYCPSADAGGVMTLEPAHGQARQAHQEEGEEEDANRHLHALVASLCAEVPPISPASSSPSALEARAVFRLCRIVDPSLLQVPCRALLRGGLAITSARLVASKGGASGGPAPALVGAGPNASLVWMQPRASSSRVGAGAKGPPPSLGAVYWHSSTFVATASNTSMGRGSGRIFVFGGVSESGPSSELAVCDVASRAWVSLTSLPSAPPGHLYMHAAVLLPRPRLHRDSTTAMGNGSAILFLGGTGCASAAAQASHTLRSPWSFDTGTLQWGSLHTVPHVGGHAHGGGGDEGGEGDGYPARRASLCAVLVPPPSQGVDATSATTANGRVYVYGGLSLDRVGGAGLCGPWAVGAVLGDLWSLSWRGCGGGMNGGEEGVGQRLQWRRECAAPVAGCGGSGLCMAPPARYGATLSLYDPCASGVIGKAVPDTESRLGTSALAITPQACDVLASPGQKLVLIGGRDTPIGASDGLPTGVVERACQAVLPGSWPGASAVPEFPPHPHGHVQGHAARGLPSLPDVSVWDCTAEVWVHPLVLGSPPPAAVWHSTVPVKHWMFVLGGLAGQWAWEKGGGAGRGVHPGMEGSLGTGYAAMACAAKDRAMPTGRAAQVGVPVGAPGVLPFPPTFPRMGVYILDMHTLHWTEPVLALPAQLPAPPAAATVQWGGQDGAGGGSVHTQLAYVLPPFTYGHTALAALGSGGGAGGVPGKARDRIILFGGASPGLCTLNAEESRQSAAGEAGMPTPRPPSSSLFLSVSGLVQEVDIHGVTGGAPLTHAPPGASTEGTSIVMLTTVAMPIHKPGAAHATCPAASAGHTQGQARSVNATTSAGHGFRSAVGRAAVGSARESEAPAASAPPGAGRTPQPCDIAQESLSWAEEWDRAEALDKAAKDKVDAEARERARAKAVRKSEKEQAKHRKEKERERGARGKEAVQEGGPSSRATDGESSVVSDLSPKSTGQERQDMTSASPIVPVSKPKLSGGCGKSSLKHTLAGKLSSTPPLLVIATTAAGPTPPSVGHGQGQLKKGGKKASGTGVVALAGSDLDLNASRGAGATHTHSGTASAPSFPMQAVGVPAQSPGGRIGSRASHYADETDISARERAGKQPLSQQGVSLQQLGYFPALQPPQSVSGPEVRGGAGQSLIPVLSPVPEYVDQGEGGIDEIDRLLRQALELAPVDFIEGSHTGRGSVSPFGDLRSFDDRFDDREDHTQGLALDRTFGWDDAPLLGQALLQQQQQQHYRQHDFLSSTPAGNLLTLSEIMNGGLSLDSSAPEFVPVPVPRDYSVHGASAGRSPAKPLRGEGGFGMDSVPYHSNLHGSQGIHFPLGGLDDVMFRAGVGPGPGLSGAQVDTYGHAGVGPFSSAFATHLGAGRPTGVPLPPPASTGVRADGGPEGLDSLKGRHVSLWGMHGQSHGQGAGGQSGRG